MSLFKKFFIGFFVIFLITAGFLYINLEDVVYYVKEKKLSEDPGVQHKYIEVNSQGDS